MALRDLVFRIFARDETGKAFDDVSRKLGAVDGATASINERINRAGRSMQRFGGQSAVASGAAALGLRAVIRDSAEFEAALNRAGAILKPTATDTAALEAAALAMGRSTKFSAIEAADAIEVLARNGLTAAQVLDGALAASLSVAAASGSGLGDAADVVTDSMASFGLEAAAAARVADQMAGVMSSSKFTFDDFRLALGQGGGVAGGLGVTFEDFNAVIATTASLFASGSDSGTAFKTFLTRLSPETKPAREAMERLGLTFHDAEGNMLGMAEIAGELDRALSGLSDVEKSGALKAIFGNDAMRTAIGLMDAGAEGIRNMTAAIAETSAADLAAARMEGAAGATLRFKAATEGLNIAIGSSGLLDAFTGIVEGAAGIINKLSALDSRILQFGAALGVLVAVLAPLGFILGSIAVAAAALGGPFVAAAAALAVVGAAAFALRDDIAAVWSFIAEKLAAMPEWVAEMARKIRDNLLTAINPFRALRGAVEDAEAGFAWLYDRVVGNSWVPDMVDAIGEHFGRLAQVMTAPAEAEAAAVSDVFEGLERKVGDRLGRMAADGKVTWSGFFGSLLDIGASYRDRINREVFDGLATGALGKVGVDAGASGGLGGFLGSALSSLGSGLLSSLPGFANGGSFSAATGRGGVDRNVAAFRVSRDEDVTVSRRGDAPGGRPVVVNIYAQDVQSFERSRAQVGRQIGRAVGAGQRGM